MPQTTPFHPRTAPLCESHAWRQWAGYLAVSQYRDFVQPEVAAIRHSAALIDVSPLYKVRLEGPGALALAQRVVTHDAAKMSVGQVLYTPWCDEDGKIRQEGTLFRLGETSFRLYAAEPVFSWLRQNAFGLDVELVDESADFAGLALQGPHSRAILADAGVSGIDDLRFFRFLEGELAGAKVIVSRTGYTGDLGYEIWLPKDAAIGVWDALQAIGEPYHLRPAGIVAMDVARVEAGFVLLGVDYLSSETAIVEGDMSTPYELGLGWAVKLGKGPFVGRRALAAEKARGSAWKLVGLEIDWEPLERLYLAQGIMPDLPFTVDRDPVPVYSGMAGDQVGQVTSRVWSSLLKKYIALASIKAPWTKTGTELAMEVTVRYSRRRAPARVVKLPFYRPERMRA